MRSSTSSPRKLGETWAEHGRFEATNPQKSYWRPSCRTESKCLGVTAWTYLHLHIHVNSVCIRIIYCTFTYILHVYRSIPVCSMSGQIILHTSPNVANIYGDIPHVLLGVTCPDICPIVFWQNINTCYKPNRIHVWYIYLHLVDLCVKYTMHGSYGYVHNIQNSKCKGQKHTSLSLCPFCIGHDCLVQGDVIWLQGWFASKWCISKPGYCPSSSYYHRIYGCYYGINILGTKLLPQ